MPSASFVFRIFLYLLLSSTLCPFSKLLLFSAKWSTELSKQSHYVVFPFFLIPFCHLGTEDLGSGRVVTPLSRNETFLDDPPTVLRAIRFGLEKVWELKPLVNGMVIMNVLQLKDGGPLVKDNEEVSLGSLYTPIGTAEDCLDWIREMHQKPVKPD